MRKAYFTILGHQPTAAGFARTSAQKNISDVLRLHDDLLGHLQRLIPFAEYDQRTAKALPDATLKRSHTRWHSVDVVRPRLTAVKPGRRSLNISRSSEQDHLALRCSPQIVAGVADMFLSLVRRLRMHHVLIKADGDLCRCLDSASTKTLVQTMNWCSATSKRQVELLYPGLTSTGLSKHCHFTSTQSSRARQTKEKP